MITIILSTVAAIVLLHLAWGHRRMWRALAAPTVQGALTVRANHEKLPSVTIVRPIKGEDVGYRENTEALLAQDYPGDVETLFVFDSASDPAFALVAELAQKARAAGKDARIVFAGPRPARRTGKLNAMIAGMAQARGELIAFCDSDARPSPKLLAELVTNLRERPEAGSAFAPAATLGTPTSFGEVVYGLMINSWYGAAAAEIAGERRELPFIMGQLMVFRREALTAIGGLKAAEGQLVDDMFLGAALERAGYHNVMVRSPLHLVTGPLSLRALMALLRKWMAFSRSGLPATFVRHNFLRGADLGLALAIGAAALFVSSPLALGLASLVLAAFVYSQLALYRRFSGAAVPLSFAWVPLVVPFLSGALLATTRLVRSVEWRGQAYKLDASALLSTQVSPTGAGLSSQLLARPRRNPRLRRSLAQVAARARQRHMRGAHVVG